jgi:hypothetical protein
MSIRIEPRVSRIVELAGTTSPLADLPFQITEPIELKYRLPRGVDYIEDLCPLIPEYPGWLVQRLRDVKRLEILAIGWHLPKKST